MSSNLTCPQCHAPLAPSAPAGLCAKCLVTAAAQSDPRASQTPSMQEFEPTAPATSLAPFQPPTVEQLAKNFPQLEVLELIGKGGMGAVYKARQPGLDRFVAVKILPPEVGRDPHFAERFTREARAMAKLNHPNIVGVYDFGQTAGLFYFVMEFIDGTNLRQAMHAGKLQPAEALAIVPQICDALQYAHDEGIVHRDIKPENILLDKRGRVKIADFGLSKLVHQGTTPEVSLTGTEQVMGTVRYMAPEQMHGTRYVDHRADIYSLGVVFYELLTGDVPMGSFDPPSKRVQVDVRLDEVVLRALAQEPEKRYQHASDVKTDVETVAHSQPAEVKRRPAAAVAANAEDTDLEAARAEVRVPAIGLMVCGILSGMVALSPLLFAMFAFSWAIEERPAIRNENIISPQGALPPHRSEPELAATRPPLTVATSPAAIYVATAALGQQAPPPPVQAMHATPMWFMVILGLPLSVVLFFVPLANSILLTLAGWRMLHLQSHGLAVFAAIVAVLPCSPVFLISVIFGVWALSVLGRPHVKAAFNAVRPSRRSNAASTFAGKPPLDEPVAVEPQPVGIRRSVWKIIAGICVAIVLLGFGTNWLLRKWRDDGNRELPVAARNGDGQRVLALWKWGANVEALDDKGNPPIVAAAMGGHNQVIEILLRHNANVDARDAQGETALMEAAYNGHASTVDLLLQRGANPRAKDSLGQLSLYWALVSGDPYIAEKLLQNQNDVHERDASGNPMISVAAMKGNVKTIETLLANGAEVNDRDMRSETPLMEAAYFGHTAAVRALLQAKADVNAVDVDGATALDWAVARNQQGAVEVLLQNQADETATYHLWRGTRAAQAGEFNTASEHFTKAYADLPASNRYVLFQVNNERFHTQHGRALALAMLASCEIHAQQTEHAKERLEALRKLVEKNPCSLLTLVKLSPNATATGVIDLDNLEVFEYRLAESDVKAALAETKLLNLGYSWRSIKVQRSGGREMGNEQHATGTMAMFFAKP